MNNDIKEILQKESDYLKKMIKAAQERKKYELKGSLMVAKRNNRLICYHCYKDEVSKKMIRKYIPKSEIQTARNLAQKYYDHLILRKMLPQIQAIDSFLKIYDDQIISDVASLVSENKKALLDSTILDNETFAKRWQEFKYTPGDFTNNNTSFYTIKGERVRSKSEVMIADMLEARAVPYHYELPLRMGNGQIWRPDFTILNKRTRKLYIHDHFGMMDDAGYCEQAVGKLQVYMQNGYYPGENLIITMETKNRPFSSKDYDQIIDRYFL